MNDSDAQLLALASTLADAAREVTLGLFGQPLPAERKADSSPVTRADRDAEARMRDVIRTQAPTHGIIGEEYGTHNPDARHVWVLDPIDGTKAFITGKPLWGTLIGCLRDGAPCLGVIDVSALSQRWLGIVGSPTTLNGARCATSDCSRLEDARLGCTSPDMFSAAERSRFDALGAKVWFRSFGGDCSAYAALASGHLELVVEADLQPYDYLPLIPVIEGAGGLITDWSGAPLGRSGRAEVLAAANPALHAAALAVLRADP